MAAPGTRPRRQKAHVGSRILWSAYAVLYDRIWDSPLTTRLASELIALSAPGGKVADLGCGTGLIARHYLAAGYEVVGIDSSPAMLRRAVTKHRVSAAALSPAEDTNFPTGSASTVIVSNVLHLHHDPTLLLTEAARLVDDDGRIILTWPSARASHDQLLRADLASGRGLGSSMLADTLRRSVVLVATMLLPRRTSLPAIEMIVSQAASQHGYLVARRTYADCQELVLLTRGISPPSRPGDRFLSRAASPTDELNLPSPGHKKGVRPR